MSLSLLLEFDGTNGSTTVTDDSGIAKTISVNGTCQLSSTKARFGPTSLRLPFATTSYVSVTQSASEMSMSGDFAFNFWINRDAVSASQCAFAFPSGDLYLISDSSSGSTMRFESGIVASLLNLPMEIPADDWVAIGMSRKGDKITVFRNGARVGSVTSSATFNFSGMQLGRYAPNGNLPFGGYVDRFHLYKDEYLWEYGYDPTTLVAADSIAPKLQGQAIRLLGDMPSTPSWRLSTPFNKVRDMYHSGLGRIQGTVKEDSSPSDLPLRRRVRLFREVDGLIVRETWSDAATGVYSFDNIDMAGRYFVVAFDYEYNYRAVIADNLQPELMP